MTDKEFKRLSRPQLIEIIYQFQLKVEELTQENQSLNAALEDKRLRITKAGNIAEAALEVNNVMQSAQNAAQQYLDEIKALYDETDEECENIRKKANVEADAVREEAKANAVAVVTQAQTDAAAIISQAQAKAASILERAQTQADAIVEHAVQRRQAETQLEEIISEYGDSSVM